MIAFSLLLALATLLVGLGLAFIASRMPRLWAQVATLALAAIALPLGAVMIGGALMLSSGHDITVLATLVAAGLAALVGVWLIGRRLLAPVRELQRTTARISSGDLSARTRETGPREMQELGAAFNAMAEHLEELQDARTQLVAWASHDLRAPLANLQAMLEAVEDGVAPAERYVPAMGDQVRALGDLVDDLFELARLDAGSLTLEIQNVRVNSLVESCVRGVEAEAQARGVKVVSAVDDELPDVLCAPDKVERVLYNLVTNALRHTPDDGAVALRVESEADHVLVSVEDTGEGLSHEALNRMFDHFWRGDRARVRDRAGAGLGLAIARGVIEAHGGNIWAENRSDGGARISFTLLPQRSESSETSRTSLTLLILIRSWLVLTPPLYVAGVAVPPRVVMRAFEDTQALHPPKLAWLVALLAAAAVMLAPATALGEEVTAVACDPATEECATAAAVTTETTTEDPAAGVSEEPVVSEEVPVPEETTPPVTEETTEPVVPTPRINPVEEPTLVVAEAADVPPVVADVPPVSTPDPAAPAAPDTPAAASPFVATSVPDEPAAAPDAAPVAPPVPDYSANKVLADAPPADLVTEVAPAATKAATATTKPQFDIGAFTKTEGSAGRFVEGLGTAASVLGDDGVGAAEAGLLTVSEVLGTSTEWIRPAVAEPRNLLEVLATYLVPGEGGSYTATLAALIQLAFVLVMWGLLRPRPVSSSIAALRSSRAVGYRAVVFRPG